MANQNHFELTSRLEQIFRKTVPLKAGSAILQGQWFNLDVNGEAQLVGATPTNVAYLSYIQSDRPDVSGVLPGGTSISLGGMTGLVGVFEGNVDNGGYDDTKVYAQNDSLTIKLGKLTPALTGEPIFAYVTLPLGADGLLYITGNSGFPIGVA